MLPHYYKKDFPQLVDSNYKLRVFTTGKLSKIINDTLLLGEVVFGEAPMLNEEEIRVEIYEIEEDCIWKFKELETKAMRETKSRLYSFKYQ